jgi:hypothetical protein
MHGLGGAAAAYFLYRGIVLAEAYSGPLRAFVRHLLAFGMTCFVAMLWEVAEFWGDRILGTRTQLGLGETMGDLMSGIAGALTVLVLIAGLEHRKRRG